MRRILALLLPRSIRGQIMAIVVVAVLLVIVMGRMLEVVGRDVIGVTDLEAISERMGAAAQLIQQVPGAERDVILDATTRAGYDFEIVPTTEIEALLTPPSRPSLVGWLAGGIFPSDDIGFSGGRRIDVDGRHALLFDLDSETKLIASLPDTMLTVDVVAPLSYYLLSFAILVSLFSLFAVRVVTEPLKVMSRSVQAAEFGAGDDLFEERGTSEIAGLARALNDMRLRIRDLIGTRTRMLRSVSHDLRTPLTRLRMRAERVEDEALQGAMLSDIHRIDALINETLNYLRDDGSTEAMQKADIASILQTICSDFSDFGSSVTYEGPNRLVGMCKPTALTRAITNLCDNGVKFADHVVVSLGHGCETLTIEVADDGPGIASDQRAVVLEPFFKLDAARGAHAKSAGFGLGLSIVAEIVRGHSGRFRFNDNEPHGLIAVIELPHSEMPA